MKAIVFWLALLPLAFAASIDLAAYDASNGMKWMGEVVPGQVTTLYGDLKSIYAQILAINPDYNSTGLMAHNTEKLDKRMKDGGSCGIFATGDMHDFEDQMNFLAKVGGACGVNGKSCIRLACENTSGTYLCNDNEVAIFPHCDYLSSYVFDIWVSCATGSMYHAMSGQEFDTRGYNVVLAYANCNHPATEPPGRKPWGPNGPPCHRCDDCVHAKLEPPVQVLTGGAVRCHEPE